MNQIEDIKTIREEGYESAAQGLLELQKQKRIGEEGYGTAAQLTEPCYAAFPGKIC